MLFFYHSDTSWNNLVKNKSSLDCQNSCLSSLSLLFQEWLCSLSGNSGDIAFGEIIKSQERNFIIKYQENIWNGDFRYHIDTKDSWGKDTNCEILPFIMCHNKLLISFTSDEGQDILFFFCGQGGFRRTWVLLVDLSLIRDGGARCLAFLGSSLLLPSAALRLSHTKFFISAHPGVQSHTIDAHDLLHDGDSCTPN